MMNKNNEIIEELNQLNQYFNEKEYLYRMLFENLYNVVIILDYETGNIVEANQAAIDYYGYSKEKLLTMQIQDISTLCVDKIEEEVKLDKNEPKEYFQSIHRLANNELREVEVRSFQIETGNKVLLVFTVYDISEKIKQKLMFDKLFFESPDAVVILDKEQRIVNVNKNFTNLFQYDLQDVKGRPLNPFISPFHIKTEIDNNIKLVYEGSVVKQEGLRKRKDGKLVEVDILAYPIIYHRSVIGVYVIYTDITPKKEHERQLLLFKNVLENNSEGVVITDVNGDIKWVNNAFSEITGYKLEEVLGENMSILRSGLHDDNFYEEMWHQLHEKGRWKGEVWNKNKNGDIYSEWLIINSIKDNRNQNKYYVGIIKDLSEKKKLDHRMNDLQQKDALTGLYNRNYFLSVVDTYIEKCREQNENLAIIFINIQGFKEINDSLGHDLGDKLLIELSKRLQLLMNDNYFLARSDGDEFVILCKSVTDDSDIKRFANTLLSYIKKPFIIESAILNIIVNIGISIFPQDGVDADTLVQNADIAMSKAREKTDDKICFYVKEMSAEINERFLLANYLIDALSNNQFTLNYQPIFDIKTSKKIMALEALLRWRNPLLGAVPPDKFIPLAEKTGQIITIGEWVLREVCQQINLWQHKGYHVVPIAVNISVKQLEQVGFAKTVMEIMKRYNVDSHLIELEITESVSTGNLATIRKNLKELKMHGIKISMDDFGTGFSSLAQLNLFDLDKLKIDKGFIEDLVYVTRRQYLVKSIIAMARSLDLVIVAEGIETKEQLEYLEKLGCDLGQGYLFCKPLPVNEAEFLLERCK